MKKSRLLAALLAVSAIAAASYASVVPGPAKAKAAADSCCPNGSCCTVSACCAK